VFHPSDIAFVEGWSARAPGIDGWRIALDPPHLVERVAVLPPGSVAPVFYITRRAARTVIERQTRDGLEEVGEYANLREAVQALCPISEEALVEIHEQLERDFPRRAGR
jgi:hypothetical protein